MGKPRLLSHPSYLRWGEFAIESTIRVLAFSSIGFVILIFFLVREGFPIFWETSPDYSFR